MLVSRWVILLLIGIARGCIWLIEQPDSTLLPRHPKFEYLEFLRAAGSMSFSRLHLWMGLYGAPSPKPTTV